ncbi:MAG: Membrane dipeptidase [Clostridia bacterium]|jgi:membrane dipeptidase|nr:Membrane dipeptidase [Clostridia bacterium]
MIDSLNKQIEENRQFIQLILNKKDLNAYLNCKEKKLGIILTVEDAICLEKKIENIQKLYDMGIRAIGLTWNGKNQLASGASCMKDEGLSKFGEEVVKKMNEIGIIIDVSHLSEKSFFDVMNITKKPVIASHSCSKYICNHRRNLSDEQIKLISKNSGMICLNFYKEFVNVDPNKADLKSFVNHIKHIYSIAGKQCIGIGSDYDGIKKKDTITLLEDNSKLVNLMNFLKKEKFTDEEIDGILWRNQLNFLKKNLK